MSRFTLLSGDASGIPALYVRKDDASTYSLYEVNLWEDLDSSAVETYGKYNVQAGIVDVTWDSMPDALRSSGWQIDARTGDIVDTHSGDVVAAFESKRFALCIVEAMWHHGAKDVAYDGSGNNLRALVREAKGAL
jgi:hypothetical protein